LLWWNVQRCKTPEQKHNINIIDFSAGANADTAFSKVAATLILTPVFNQLPYQPA